MTEPIACECYMRRAIELALRGTGAVNPNPRVGAVIVKDGKIIGEGYHRRYGDLHAERDALRDAAERGSDVSGAEIYVTLEPCCHHGKQPPCTEAIIASGITRVYVGSDDPNPLVAGKGIQQLRAAGIEVYEHVCKDECDAINRAFFHYITYSKPYVVYKYAMSLDGKTALESGESQWISCPESRERVQEFRSELTGIMVGINTVLKDNPMLTSRPDTEVYTGNVRNPVRIVCDSRLRIPVDCRLVETAGDVRTIVAVAKEYVDALRAYKFGDKEAEVGITLSDSAVQYKQLEDKVNILQQKGVEVLQVESMDMDLGSASEDIGVAVDSGYQLDLPELMRRLGEIGIDSILLEGGGTLAWSMMSRGLVDEIRCFMAPIILGGERSLTPVRGEGVGAMDKKIGYKRVSCDTIGDDIYSVYIR